VVLTLTGGLVPEWNNGRNGHAAPGDFVVTACAQASALFGAPSVPGVYIRPAAGVDLLEARCVSEKEGLLTPLGEAFYPVGYPQPLTYDRYRTGLDGWRIGENPGAALVGTKAVALAYERFGMLGLLSNESPENRLLSTADILAALMSETGVWPPCASSRTPPELTALRLDFQAYGLSRLMLQWLLEKKGKSRLGTQEADAAFQEAFAAWRAGSADAVRASLRDAFTRLASLRAEVSSLRLSLMEFPHMGILLENGGWFELEWPHYARKTLEQYRQWAEGCAWHPNIEGGASCWRQLAHRYPAAVDAVRRLWENGAMELTNGTFSLPLSLISPLLMQYWQFACGHRVFREVFGRVPETYQAQEHALAPQQPELLLLFGYRQALHMSQNRGSAPGDAEAFIRWKSPGGHALPAMVARHPSLAGKGINYYLDVPLVHAEFGDDAQEINYVNFMDFGSIPFRTQMVRAHGYAPVFGTYCTPSARFREACPEAARLPERCYGADDYTFSFYYRDATHVNAFSQHERVLALTHRIRQLQFAAWLAGREAEIHPVLVRCFEETCLQEAHDVLLVQGQRRGEFFKATETTSPYTRDTLGDSIALRAEETRCRLDALASELGGAEPTLLLNAAEVALSFARVRQADRFSGSLIEIGGQRYAGGGFPPWQAVPPAALALADRAGIPAEWGVWRLGTADDALALTCNGQSASLRVVDAAHGVFTLGAVRVRAAGSLLTIELSFDLKRDFLQSAVLDVTLDGAGTLAEVGIRHAPGRGFDPARRATDYLAVEVQLPTPVAKVWRFNPNVRSTSVEDFLASPYFLAVEDVHGEALSLMNEGAMVYRIARQRGRVHACFHVADETCWQRRMALAFGTADAFQLSRAWSQGLLPVSAEPKRNLADWFCDGWAGLSAEGFAADGRMLLSNLRDDGAEWPFTPSAPAFPILNVAAESRRNGRPPGSADIVALEPFELALAGPFAE